MKNILKVIVAILALAGLAVTLHAQSTNAPTITPPTAQTQYTPLSVWLPPTVAATAQSTYIAPFRATLGVTTPSGQVTKVTTITQYADGTVHYAESYCATNQLPTPPLPAFRK